MTDKLASTDTVDNAPDCQTNRLEQFANRGWMTAAQHNTFAGTDRLFGSEDVQDTFVWRQQNMDGGTDYVRNFDPSECDRVQLHGVSQDQVSLSFNGMHTILRIGQGDETQQIIQIENVNLVGERSEAAALLHLIEQNTLTFSY
ncbi:hypothetical protein [Paludibacterium purpuratum]|uniref:Uncharacterized protein n=1 Tax=Paludibacterium purpuratum TaxID=1144873 RepID=A0A4R7B9S1_9NEIS|nr:hypothetical protein [Paludibacterium purpuratum]TDR80575.1 hypothetical protein DFP86_10473 [Paludibacterium purpuratum]